MYVEDQTATLGRQLLTRIDYARAKVGSLTWCGRYFLDAKEADGLAAGTLGSYERKIRKFINWATEQELGKAGEVTLDHTRGYIMALKAAGCGDVGLASEARVVRTFIRWLAREEIVDQKVADRFPMPRQPKQVVRPYALEDVHALVDAAKKTRHPERDLAVILFFVDTGCRASEICGIKDEHLERDRCLVRGKGNKERWVPLSPRTIKAIRAWQLRRPEDAEWLFVTRFGTQFTRWDVFLLFKRLQRLAGVDGRVYAHRMRHTTAVEFLRDGGGPFELQKMLGHESIGTTQKYIRMTADDVVREHRKHSLVERLSRSRSRR